MYRPPGEKCDDLKQKCLTKTWAVVTAMLPQANTTNYRSSNNKNISSALRDIISLLFTDTSFYFLLYFPLRRCQEDH